MANNTFFPVFILWCSSVIALALIWLVIIYSGHHHSPQPVLFPIVNLVSFTATTLSYTTPATWNLTISLSNPNPESTIYYNHFNVSLFYHNNNNSNNSNSTVFVGGDASDSFVREPPRCGILLSSNVSFSTHNLGKKDAVESYLEDQKKGYVGVIIEASHAMSFNKDDGWKMEGIFSVGVNVYFKKSSGNNKTGLGSALGLPKEFQFYNL